MIHRTLLLSAAALAAAVLSVAGARAEDPPPLQVAGETRAQARAHYVAAEKHFRRQEWREALAEYQQALAFKNHVVVMVAAAVCLRQLGQYHDALDRYEALRREFPVLSAGMEAKVAPAIAELQGLVGTLVVAGDAPAGPIAAGVEQPTSPQSVFSRDDRPK